MAAFGGPDARRFRIVAAGNASERAKSHPGRFRVSMPQVTLPARSLEALASETRIRLLKSLVSHQLTLAQLTEAVGRDKAVIHRHLRKLLHGGFVEKDERYSFTYYRLTWRGRGVVAPSENTRIALLLGGALALGGGMVATLALALGLSTPAFSVATAGVAPTWSRVFVGVLTALGATLSAALLSAGWRRLRPRRSAAGAGSAEVPNA